MGAGVATAAGAEVGSIRCDGQWLYQSRQYNIIYNGPGDLSGTYTPLPAE